MSFGMILLIGYLVLSFLVAIAFYAACVMAARVEEAEQKRAVYLSGKPRRVVQTLQTAKPTQRLQPHMA